MRGIRPTPGPKAVREHLTQARSATLERKQRTRKLIQMGDVLASYGFESSDELDQLMQAMVGNEENRQWLIDRGVQHTER